MFQIENYPFLPPSINQLRTKGNDSEFFAFFPSTLGRARHGAKKEGDVTKEKNTLFGFDEKKKKGKKEATASYIGV